MAEVLALGLNFLAEYLFDTAQLQDFAHPSFLDVWRGPERLEYRIDDGTLLRVENRRKAESDFLHAVARAT